MANGAPLATDYSGVREYIGARYVPVFANPLAWSDQREYEPLTIVTYQGNSYTSMQYVPTGIDIGNTAFWALTGNYNAQVEGYRQEVLQFDSRISENEANIEKLTTDLSTTDSKIHNYTELVVFGDSWADKNVADVNWPDDVAVTLGLNVHNYAVSGSGDDIEPQITAFKNDESYDKNAIKYVVIMAGVNITYSSSTYPKWLNIINQISNEIPNSANIYWFMDCFGKYVPTTESILDYMGKQRTAYWNMYNLTQRCKFVLMNDWFGENEFNETGYHLTAGAQRQHLAPNVAAILNGGNVLKYSQYLKRFNMNSKAAVRVIQSVSYPAIVKTEFYIQMISGQSFTANTPVNVTIPGYLGYNISNIEFTVDGVPFIIGISTNDGTNVTCAIMSSQSITFNRSVNIALSISIPSI